MKSILYLLICVCWVVIGNANAQYSRIFTIETGLSSSLINNLYQDKRGDIWISTGYGLNRYDGAKFINYKSIKNDSTSLLCNNVYSVYEYEDGLFVLSTDGLQAYDYSTDKFYSLLFSGNNYNNKCILKRKDGTILLGTSGYGIKVLHIDNNGESKASDLNNNYYGYNINSLLEDNNGNLWIATEFDGLICVLSDGTEHRYTSIGNDSIDCINLCVMDSEGRLYISSVGNGVYVYSRNEGNFKKIYDTRYPVTSIVQRGGRMLIGTDGDGIAYYDIMTGNTGKSEFLISDINLSEAKVHSIVVDKYDNLWIGVFQKGVVFIPANTNKFGYIGVRSTLNNSIGDKCVTGICCDSEGNFLVGTDNDGIYILDENYKMISHLSPRKQNPDAPHTVMCMLRDTQDRIWVGSYLDGLSILDTKKRLLKKISFQDNKSSKADKIYALAEDMYGRIWVGTMGVGLYYIDPTNPNKVNDILRVGSHELELNKNVNLWINSLYCSPSGILYIGTVDGIKCLDLNTASYIDPSSVLRGNTITSICQDSAGSIWIGTIDGIKVFTPDLSKMLVSYSVEDGLPSNNIASITNDSSGNMWVSTNLGLAKFDLHTETFNSFRTSYGLYNNEFSKNAFYKDKNGMLYWGGTSGIVYFNPEEIKVEPSDYNIRITGLYLHGKPVNGTTMSGRYRVLSRELITNSNVNLSYLDNSFTIEFANDNFGITPTLEFSMDGGNWNSLKQGMSSVSFSNLSTGKHIFTVRDKTSRKSSATLKIIIHPAWYASWWAKTAYCMIAIFLFLFILYQVRMKYMVKQEMIKHKLQEEANEAKLQFFINVSHEIRTPMSLIISPLHKLISSDKNVERQKNYSLIERNAERILTLINQLMDTRKIDKQQMKLKFAEVDLVSFIKDIIDIFSYQADCKGIKVNVLSEKERVNAWVDPNNFDKVILNLLSNSFKHVADNGEINIYIKTGTDEHVRTPLNNYIEIVVEDNGTGIKENEIEHIFERFYQISDDSSYKLGTGIGLHLTMSLVKLHHGVISAKNNTNKPGCSFTIRIPLGKEHLSEQEIIDNKSEYLRQRTEVYEKTFMIEEKTTEEDNTKKTIRKKHTLLIVEDDEEIRNYLVSELDSLYRVVQCKNGKEALRILASNAPDLILSDVMMPEVDGLTLLRKIKQNIKINHIPVVLLTAKNSESDNMEGLSFGADAYLTKPFNIDMVRITIENLLKNRDVLKNNFSGKQEQDSNIVYIKPESSDDKLMKKIMKAINNNISNPELNVEMIAAEVGISRVHLYRKLKELTNQSTRDFIRNIRLKQAEALLMSDKNYNVSEIALLVGFNNATYFSNAFKELYGMSPSKYVEINKGKNKI